MSGRVSQLVLAILGICLVTTAFGLEVPLKYEKYPERPRELLPPGYRSLDKTTDVPQGDWKLPKLKSKLPVYAMVKLGNKERLLILDRKNADDSFYNRLYFDANGNHDLTDDPVIDGTVQMVQFGSVSFPAIDTVVEVDGKLLPYSFRSQVYQFGVTKEGEVSAATIERNMQFNLSVNCCYRGQFSLDGQSYLVALGDSNCNGYFNDKLSLRQDVVYGERHPVYPEGDHIYLTTGEALDYYGRQVCSDKVLLDGKLLDLAISTPESKLTLTPCTEKVATLRLPMETERLTLYAPDGKHSILMYKAGKEINIPPGDYRLLSYLTVSKDSKGDLWRLCAGGTEESPTVTVGGNGSATLPFGAPYLPFAEVPEWSKQNFNRGVSEVYLTFFIEGQGKELATDLSHTSGTLTDIPLSKSDSTRPKEPSYKIMKSDGTIVAQGTFAYG